MGGRDGGERGREGETSLHTLLHCVQSLLSHIEVLTPPPRAHTPVLFMLINVNAVKMLLQFLFV